jgi:hypothetical protein
VRKELHTKEGFSQKRAYPKKIDTAGSGFNRCSPKSLGYLVASFVTVQFAFGCDAMLRNEFAGHV